MPRSLENSTKASEVGAFHVPRPITGLPLTLAVRLCRAFAADEVLKLGGKIIEAAESVCRSNSTLLAVSPRRDPGLRHCSVPCRPRAPPPAAPQRLSLVPRPRTRKQDEGSVSQAQQAASMFQLRQGSMMPNRNSAMTKRIPNRMVVPQAPSSLRTTCRILHGFIHHASSLLC